MEFHLNIVSVAFHTILLKYSFRSLAIYPANFIPTPTRGLLSFFYNLTNVQRFWNLAPQKLHISRQPATTSFYTPVAKLFTRRLLSREIARAETTIVRDNRYDRICQTCCKSLKKKEKTKLLPHYLYNHRPGTKIRGHFYIKLSFKRCEKGKSSNYLFYFLINSYSLTNKTYMNPASFH